jgi:hypothetical protein
MRSENAMYIWKKAAILSLLTTVVVQYRKQHGLSDIPMTRSERNGTPDSVSYCHRLSLLASLVCSVLSATVTVCHLDPVQPETWNVPVTSRWIVCRCQGEHSWILEPAACGR